MEMLLSSINIAKIQKRRNIPSSIKIKNSIVFSPSLKTYLYFLFLPFISSLYLFICFYFKNRNSSYFHTRNVYSFVPVHNIKYIARQMYSEYTIIYIIHLSQEKYSIFYKHFFPLVIFFYHNISK